MQPFYNALIQTGQIALAELLESSPNVVAASENDKKDAEYINNVFRCKNCIMITSFKAINICINWCRYVASSGGGPVPVDRAVATPCPARSQPSEAILVILQELWAPL